MNIPILSPAARRLRSASRFAKRRLGMLVNDSAGHWFDIHHGVDTSGKIAGRSLQKDFANLQHVTGYQGVLARSLRIALDRIPVPPGSVFVDIGSGKGKALLIASTKKNIARCVGIEFDAELCRSAERNIEIWKRKHHPAAELKVIVGDASTFEFRPEYNLIFVYNPFDEVLFKQVIDNLTHAAAMAEGPAWLLYGNPRFRPLLDENPAFVHKETLRFFGPGRNIAVYEIKRGTR